LTMDDAEREVFGASHADIGAYLLGLWGLPVSIVEGVALHHTPRKAALRSFSPLAAVHVANVLQHESDAMTEGAVRSVLDDAYLVDLDLKEHLPRWRTSLAQISTEGDS